LKIFVSGGSSNKSVHCSENIVPKPPENVVFQYNFKKEALKISWDFPFNKQQDIKRFQIYRRDSLRKPFEMIREYNFDDSTVTDSFSPASGNSNNILKLLSPKCDFHDPGFSEVSKYIYAIASIDARGLTSGYSDQFYVTYDRFTNTTNVKFISKSGAPKPYPNIFLESDALPDVITLNNTERLTVFFTPVSKKITLFRQDESNEPSSDIDGFTKDCFLEKEIGDYKIQLINTETQEVESISFFIQENEFKTEDEKRQEEFGQTGSSI
jgi:hypothetical protein